MGQQVQKAIGLTQPFVNVLPLPIKAARAPVSTDTGYPVGQCWADTSTSPQTLYFYAGGGTWSSNQVTLSTDGTFAGAVDTTASSSLAIKTYADGLAIAGAPDATTATKGIQRNATNAEAVTGTATNRTVTASNLPSVFAAAPAIGGTTPAAGSFTTIAASGLASLSGSATITTGATALNLASDASTGAVNIGTGAGARTLTLGNVTGATAVNVNTGTGGFTLTTTGSGDAIINSADTVLIDSAGVLELNSSAGVIGIGNDAVSQNINIGTAGTRLLTMGSATATSSVVIDGGTNGVSVGTNAVAQTVTIGNNTGATSVIVNCGTGALDIGQNAIARTIRIGNATGASSLTLTAGTGNWAATGAAGTTYTIGEATTTGIITLGQSTAAGGQTINIGSGVNAGAQIISIGNGASGANSTVNILSGVGTAGAGVLALGNNTRVTTIGLGNIAPAAARTVTVCGGNSAQDDTLNIMGGNPSANAQTVSILAGVPSGGTQVLNLLTQTGQAGTINIATGAAMANAINIGGTGANVIAIGNTQTTGSIALGNALTSGTIALGGATGTGTITIGASTAAGGQTINVGNAINTGAQIINLAGGASAANSTVNILSGNGSAGTQTLNALTGNRAGAINLGTGAAAHVIGIGSSSAGAMTINIGSGNLQLNGNANTVNIANDAAANTVVLGSTNSTSTTTIQAGTGGLTLTGTVTAGQVNAKYVTNTGDDYIFDQSPICLLSGNAPALPTGATGSVNLLQFRNFAMEQFVLGAGQTIIAPVNTASGLLVSGDLIATEGFEYNFGGALTTSRHAKTIGTSPAFFLEWNFTVADVSGADVVGIGFRKSEANNATFANYTDFAFIGLDVGVNDATAVLKTRLNSGAVTNTNTTDAWTDGQTHRLKVLVSAAGVVTYTIDGAAPTATAAFTFDNADVVVPFFYVLHAAVAPGAIHWIDAQVGAQ